VDEDKLYNAFLWDMLILSAGALCVSLSLFTTFVPGAIQTVLLLVGVALFGLSSCDLFCTFWDLHPLSWFRKLRFVKNKSGLGWVLVVGLGLSIPTCALMYFVLAYPFDLISDYMSQFVVFTGTMAYSWVATKVIISYLTAFALIFSVIWVVVNAKSPNQGYY
jgi:hypothetical protein